MELFLQPQDTFVKLAGTRMPEDPNAWPQEILQQLYKEVPYMSDFSPHVTMDKVDGEKGYAFGHVTVMNQSEIQLGTSTDAQKAGGLRQVRIPVIVKDGEMSPLDLLITDDSKVQPLTESRLRAAIFRPQAFDVTARTPGDQSMIGQLYPPYRQSQGFGGGGLAMGKEGSVLESYLEKEAGLLSSAANKAGEGAGRAMATGAGQLISGSAKKNKGKLVAGVAATAAGKGVYDTHRDKRVAKNIVAELRKQGSMVEVLAPTMNRLDLAAFKDAVRDPNTRLAYEKNAAANAIPVQVILGQGGPQHDRPKLASVMHSLLKPDVTQVIRTADGYSVKTANHSYWAPHLDILDRGSAIQKLGSRVVIAADTAGAVTIADGVDEGEPGVPETGALGAGPISDFGLYRVLSESGQELTGFVIPDLVDVDGRTSPISLFTDGTHAAIQGDIIGSPVEGGSEGLPAGGTPSGYGAFFSADSGGTTATIPMRIAGSFEPAPGEPAVHQAETYDGRPVEVSVQPNIQAVVAMEEGRMLVPAHWQWLPLGQAEAVALKSSEEDTPAEKEAEAQGMYTSVDVVSGGEQFSIRGYPVEKLAASEREFLSVDDAMFLLAGLGVEQGYGVRKLAESMLGREPVQVRIGRYIKLAEDQEKEASVSAREMLERMPSLRQNLFKEAAFITDPDAVDTVLSLNFINPENLHTFIAYLPVIDETQERLCNLLFAARMGLSDIPESALSTSVRSTEEVLEGLKTMAFQGPAYHS